MLKRNTLASARVMPNGEIRIPRNVLNSLGLRPGDPILFIDGIGGLEIVNPTMATQRKVTRRDCAGPGSQIVM